MALRDYIHPGWWKWWYDYKERAFWRSIQEESKPRANVAFGYADIHRPTGISDAETSRRNAKIDAFIAEGYAEEAERGIIRKNGVIVHTPPTVTDLPRPRKNVSVAKAIEGMASLQNHFSKGQFVGLDNHGVLKIRGGEIKFYANNFIFYPTNESAKIIGQIMQPGVGDGARLYAMSFQCGLSSYGLTGTTLPAVLHSFEDWWHNHQTGKRTQFIKEVVKT